MHPLSAFNINMEVNDCKMIVPTIVVEGQHDDLFIGTNVIKHILCESNGSMDGHLKVMNVSEQPLFLRHNAKLADLVPCVALEDLDQVSCHQSTSTVSTSPVCPDVGCAGEKLEFIGLSELDVGLCDASDCKDKLSELIVRYHDVFSRNHLD